MPNLFWLNLMWQEGDRVRMNIFYVRLNKSTFNTAEMFFKKPSSR